MSPVAPIVTGPLATSFLGFVPDRSAGFDFATFFQRRLAREFDPALIVNADTFNPNHFPDLGYIFNATNPKVGQFGDVDETILTWENFDKRAEFFDRNHATMIGLADLDFLRHSADDFLRPRHRFAAGGVDVNRTIVLDVNLSTSLGHDPLDRFATWANERTSLCAIDFGGLDSGRVLAQLRPRLGQRAGHDLKNLAPRVTRTVNRFAEDLVADARELQVELKSSDTGFGSAKFEVHVAEMIFGADDVREEVVTL